MTIARGLQCSRDQKFSSCAGFSELEHYLGRILLSPLQGQQKPPNVRIKCPAVLLCLHSGELTEEKTLEGIIPHMRLRKSGVNKTMRPQLKGTLSDFELFWFLDFHSWEI